METNKDASAVLIKGQKLAAEIEAAIKNCIIENAPRIQRFHQRRAELTKVNSPELFYYAVGLVLHFTAAGQGWTPAQINSLIDGIAAQIVVSLNYNSGRQGNSQTDRKKVAHDLTLTFQNVRHNFDRLLSSRKEELPDMTYTMVTMYLQQVYPSMVTLLAELNLPVVTSVAQTFGMLSLSAVRYSSE